MGRQSQCLYTNSLPGGGQGGSSRINSLAHLAPAFEKGSQVESLEFTGGGFKLVEENAGCLNHH